MKNIKLMLTALMLTLAVSLTAGVTADAKAYKAKKVTVTKGKSKTIKTSRKIKKVKISSKNKSFTIKKTASKKFKVSGTDVGKTQNVKVTYTNGNTQTFKITTKKAKTSTKKAIPSYAQKIVDELKPLLANPDKGLQKVTDDWVKRLKPRAGYMYQIIYRAKTGKMTISEVLKNCTASEKKALILEAYLTQRMKYSRVDDKDSYFYHRKENAFFKLLYQGKFEGVCDDGAAMTYDICQYLGIKANYVRNTIANSGHAWTCVWATNKNGTTYWFGVWATSYACNMKNSTPINKTFDGNEVDKYIYDKSVVLTDYLSAELIRIPKDKPATVTATATPVPTAAPVVMTPVPATTTEPAKAPVATQAPAGTQVPVETQTPEPTQTPAPEPTIEPTQTPMTTPTPEPAVEPTVEPARTPAPSTTTAPTPAQRVIIPASEHQYVCHGCWINHTDADNPYITDWYYMYGDTAIYCHMDDKETRFFDAEGNEYLDLNHNGHPLDELEAMYK